MLQRTLAKLSPKATAPPFLPLAFRLTASLGLLVLQIGLPEELRPISHGEWLYLSALLFFFLEALFEAEFRRKRRGALLATPEVMGVRWNLFLDLLLVSLLVAYQGVEQERFASLYLFPVLSSAFFVGTIDILGTGLFATVLHAGLVLGFSYGWIPPFGNSTAGMDTHHRLLVISVTALQVLIATLVMTFLRRGMERLRRDLKASEATVDQLAELHGRVVASMGSGLITLDSEYRITSANPAAEAILRGPVATGKPLSDYLPLSFEDVDSLLPEPRFELEFPSSEGLRILGGHLAPLQQTGGTPRGFLLLFQDLTELKTLESRTRIAERLAAVGGLTAGLAHELRNPLASIMGCVQLLKQGQHPGTQERVLGILQRESGRVNEIVAHFLDFSDPKDPRMERLPLPRLLEEVQASWETDPRTQGLPLHVQGPVPPIALEADPTLIHRILTNLLSNARKAVAEVDHPEVSIGWQQLGGRLRLWVEDNGVGMEPSQVDTLFVPFVSGFQEGSGLGMSLVYQGVQRMGWEVRVESEPGQGTRITLEMPWLPLNP
jgi:two-component system sensor histidine kinase PilS (NtrC family)